MIRPIPYHRIALALLVGVMLGLMYLKTHPTFRPTEPDGRWDEGEEFERPVPPRVAGERPIEL